MKYSLLWFTIPLLIFLSPAYMAEAQQRVDTDPHKHNHDIYQDIERDYKNGQLNIDQKVLLKFYATSNPKKLPEKYQQEHEAPVKCGTPAISDYQQSREKLAGSTISEIESMMESPTIQSSETYATPSGNFEIHYETAGSHAVPPADENENDIPDYVEKVAAAADSSYRHQVQSLGYSDPISNNQPYEIRIRNLQSFYGDTWSEGGTTYIRIENDFAEDFPPNDHPDGDQIGAVYATVAHEFKHAIQYTATQWHGETGNWLEMDATLMEEVVYDDVNDYYNYIESDDSIFNNPDESFYPGSYYHVTWALFFEEKYGSDFWPQVWEIIKQDPSGITMIDALTQQLGGDNPYRNAYTESQLWHFASGENSSAEFGFEESAHYPTPQFDTAEELFTENFTIPRSLPRLSLNKFSANYYEIPVEDEVQGDIMVEVTSSGKQKGLGVIAYYRDGTTKSSTSLISEDESSFKMTDFNWNNIERLGLVLTNSDPFSTDDDGDQTIVGVGTDNPETVELSHNYPNPFNPQTRIRFTVNETSHVELKVFDSTGRLVTKLIDEELSAGLYEPVFDGSELASGVYFYQLITERNIQTQQMTLIR